LKNIVTGSGFENADVRKMRPMRQLVARVALGALVASIFTVAGTAPAYALPNMAAFPNLNSSVAPTAGLNSTGTVIAFVANANGVTSSLPAGGYLQVSMSSTSGTFTDTANVALTDNGSAVPDFSVSSIGTAPTVRLKFTFANGWSPTGTNRQVRIALPANSTTLVEPGPVVVTIGFYNAANVAISSISTATSNFPKTVTFNSNTPSPTTYTQISGNGTTLTPVTFTRPGYVFNGWTTSPNGTVTYQDAVFYAFGSDLTLYANWFQNSFNVTFDANDGSLVPAQAAQAGFGSTNLTANSFSRAGYAFAGWDTNPTGGGTSYLDADSFPFNADVTLYAQWSAIPVAVPVAPPVAAPLVFREGPEIYGVTNRIVNQGSELTLRIFGTRLGGLISATHDGSECEILSIASDELVLRVSPQQNLGAHSVMLKFDSSNLFFQDVFTVVDPKVAEAAAANRLPKPDLPKPVKKKNKKVSSKKKNK
jgi:uncharacterized repeat protein (TIGR02543 family)